MTSKIALGKSTVSYTPILFREWIKNYFWFVNWILNLQFFHFFMKLQFKDIDSPASFTWDYKAYLCYSG